MTIARLTELPDYEVAKGGHDIRGWHVFDKTGAKAGVIEDLIVDTDARRVREVLVDLDGRDMAIPIGAITLDERGHTASINASLEEIRRMPEAPHWHSQEREVIRATFFPDLKDAPRLGELRKEDVEALDRRAYRSEDPRIVSFEEHLFIQREP